jgi:hypothetical protein
MLVPNNGYLFLNKRDVAGTYIGFRKANSDLMIIDNNGNVGINTTAPSYRLQLGTAGSLADSIRIGSYSVANNTRQYIGYARADTGLFESSGNGDSPSTVLAGVAGIRIVNTVGTVAPSQADNSVQLLTHIYNGNSRVALHANYDGNIGIGTTSPSSLLHVNGRSYIGTMTAYAPAVHIRGAYYGGPRLQVYGLDADANAWMGLGTDMSSGAYELSIYYPTNGASSVCFGKYDGTASQYGGFTPTARLSNAGTWTVAGDVVAYGSPSDITLKTNIKPLEDALEKVTKLQGVSFTWKEDTEMSKMTNLKDDVGFIAQEVQEVIPDLVRKNDNGLLSLRDKGITALLVEAIKELKAQNDILQSRIEQLENK